MIIFLKLKHSEFQGFMSPLLQANSSLPEPAGKRCAMFRGFLEVTKIKSIFLIFQFFFFLISNTEVFTIYIICSTQYVFFFLFFLFVVNFVIH